MNFKPLCAHRSKGIVFFYFPGKVCRLLTHSILSNFVFFIFRPLGKKKHLFFFFSSEKFVSHSLAKKADDPKNRSEKVKKRYLEVFFIFSRKILKTVCFFFFLEKFTLHSLTHFQRAEKKNSTGKKKHHFHSLTRFLPKSGQK